MKSATTANKLTINSPGIATKLLSFQRARNNTRKLVISTNWLVLFGFEAGDPTIEYSLGQNEGIVVERVRNLGSQPRVKKVYSRRYKRRVNNPLETLLDIRSQKLLDEAFPEDCVRVHITFSPDKVTVIPYSAHHERALANAIGTIDIFSAFCACTSGVDVWSLASQGFAINSVIEYRPNSSRDKKCLSETGALNILANIPGIKHLFNVDISLIDPKLIAKIVGDVPHTLFHASPACTEFTHFKAPTLKQKSIDNLTSTLDMGYDLLRLIEELAPPTILFENVPAWVNSEMYKLMSLRLRRWGYKEHVYVADSRDHGGLTSRKRAYCFFTVLPVTFAFEKPIERSCLPVIEHVKKYLPECREVTNVKTLQDGASCGRLRTFDDNARHAPTPTKSQPRQAKDSLVYIDNNGKMWWPSENMLKRLLGISEHFSLEGVSSGVASEIIGQSIDVPLHESIIRSVMQHISRFYYLQDSVH